MRSSSGEHYVGLDHVRALAAFMVFCWHFLHGTQGAPIPFDYVPTFPPLAFLEEGHTGVSLFMVLSGYLFAKILNGRSIRYGGFIYARALRLLPLLMLVCAIEGLRLWAAGADAFAYFVSLPYGLYRPTLPNGGWSITTEWHFYLLLPLLLFAARRHGLLLPALILVAVGFRAWIYYSGLDVQWYSYWTIIGRFDQFALGMVAFSIRQHLYGRHALAIALALSFAVYFWFFDLSGGWHNSKPYVWVTMPTIEGTFYAALIAWYDTSFKPRGRISDAIALIGQGSYSMYLLHYFVVFKMAWLFHMHILPITNFAIAVLGAALCFLALCPLAILSYQIVEMPFLKLRRPYIKPASVDAVKSEDAVV